MYTPLTLVNAGRDFTNLILGNNVYLGHGAVLDLKVGSSWKTTSRSTVATMATHFHIGDISFKARFPSKSGRIPAFAEGLISDRTSWCCPGSRSGEGA